MKTPWPLSQIILSILTALGIAGVVCFLIFAGTTGNVIPTQKWIDDKLARDHDSYQRLRFTLVDPIEAPLSIQKLAILGFKAMIDTKKIAPDHVGNDLSCTHCHFAGGNTTGSAQGGISLAGVAAKYPRFDSSAEKVIDLENAHQQLFSQKYEWESFTIGQRADACL